MSDLEKYMTQWDGEEKTEEQINECVKALYNAGFTRQQIKAIAMAVTLLCEKMIGSLVKAVEEEEDEEAGL